MIKRRIRWCLLVISFYLIAVETAFAAHPLITDDTGSQGKEKVQIEINSEFSTDKETEDDVTTKETGSEVAAIISYGITENMDVVFGIPYQRTEIKEDDAVISDEDGISDMSLEVKWRFLEKDGLSLALKPAITLPTGDEGKGLGNGRTSYGLMFITTKEIKAWTFNLNLGYMHNKYKLEEDNEANRKNLWHTSLASAVEVVKNLNAVANIGIEKNPGKNSDTNPAFILGGLIYSVSENFDIDAGVKSGLTKPETDLSFLAGMALRF